MLQTLQEISSRLVQASIVDKPNNHKENEAVKAGRQAEKDVEDMLVQLGGIPAYNVFRSLRIPNQLQTGRSEIDLVVITDHQIYCLEVKNWSGNIRMSCNNIYWDQTVKRDGRTKVIQHMCPIRSIVDKTALLRSHFARNGVFIPGKSLLSRVVMVNSNGELDPSITTSDTVITPQQLKDFAGKFQKPISSYLLDPFVPFFLGGTFSYSQLSLIRQILNCVGTWDVCELEGGKVLHGDFRQFDCDVTVSRKNCDVIEFNHNRNDAMAPLWALMGYSPTTKVRALARFDSNQSSWLPTSLDITSWLLGKQVVMETNVKFTSHVKFRIAGDRVDSKIQVNDVKKITLSL